MADRLRADLGPVPKPGRPMTREELIERLLRESEGFPGIAENTARTPVMQGFGEEETVSPAARRAAFGWESGGVIKGTGPWDEPAITSPFQAQSPEQPVTGRQESERPKEQAKDQPDKMGFLNKLNKFLTGPKFRSGLFDIASILDPRGAQTYQQIGQRVRAEAGIPNIIGTVTKARQLWEAGDMQGSLQMMDQALQSPEVQLATPEMQLNLLQFREQMGKEFVGLNRMRETMSTITSAMSPIEIFARAAANGVDPKYLGHLSQYLPEKDKWAFVAIPNTTSVLGYNKSSGEYRIVEGPGGGLDLGALDKDAKFNAILLEKSGRRFSLASQAIQAGKAGDQHAMKAMDDALDEFYKGTTGEKLEAADLARVPFAELRRTISKKFPHRPPDNYMMNDKEFRELLGTRGYIQVANEAEADAFRRGSTAGSILQELEDIVKSAPDLFPRGEEPLIKRGAKVGWGVLMEKTGVGGRFDPRLARLQAINGKLTLMSRALGESSRVSDKDREFLILGMGTTPAVREAVLARIKSYRDTFRRVYEEAGLDAPPGLGESGRTETIDPGDIDKALKGGK